MFPAKPKVPVDPKPPGQAQSIFWSGAFLGGGWMNQSQRLNHQIRLPPSRGRWGILACQVARAHLDSM